MGSQDIVHGTLGVGNDKDAAVALIVVRRLRHVPYLCVAHQRSPHPAGREGKGPSGFHSVGEDALCECGHVSYGKDATQARARVGCREPVEVALDKSGRKQRDAYAQGLISAWNLRI